MGRGRKGITEQSQRKPKRTDSANRRGKTIFAFVKNRETKKFPVPEHVLAMKLCHGVKKKQTKISKCLPIRPIHANLNQTYALIHLKGVCRR